MKRIFLLTSIFTFLCSALSAQQVPNQLRAPAYPLITIDPNMSAWSYTDALYDSSPAHWSDKKLPFLGVMKVGDDYYRFMGAEELQMETIAPNGEDVAWQASFTTSQPAGAWFNQDFDASDWEQALGAFGTIESEPHSKTDWSADKIWIRRTVDIQEDLSDKSIYLDYSHDDDTEIYINGIQVVDHGGTGKNKRVKLSQEVTRTLKPGKTVIAAYCFNGGANGFIDVGLSLERTDQSYFSQTAQQISVDVQPMQTHYVFACGDVELKVSFTAPLFLDNLDLLGRPINYLSYQVQAPAGQQVELYFEVAPDWALHLPTQTSSVETFKKNGVTYLKTGSVAQKILERKGDHVRNDWGYFYLASDHPSAKGKTGSSTELRQEFLGLPVGQERQENAVAQLALTQKMTGSATGRIALGYDDVYAIQYFGENLRPYWNRNEDSTIETQFEQAFTQYEEIKQQADAFDAEFMKDYTRFGKPYAELCALAYRQSIAAHKLVESPSGELLWLSKENDSNGSIGTVDVTYPSAPLYLYYNPELAKGLINFIFHYTESGKWTKQFPAHDIGTYPIANGQTYGGDMPVEESGNMLVLTYAIAQAEGNADYAKQHWEALTMWADYLIENGLDPDNQLCTDDFAGHFAHNANLSIKAIMGVASYGYLAGMLHQEEVAERYIAEARNMAKQWEEMSRDGDHYKLTFDKPGTWSQKYNLVWDKLLGMEIFDKDIIEKEIAYYLTKQNKYGLPLDSRETYTKTDWIFWTATMADDLATFQQFIRPVHSFMNETVNRVPMSDWVFTDKPERRGFKARSVVGGYFIKMLEEKYKKRK